jgi:regulator of replication initiation timing
MKIHIPKDEAIKILNDRLSDINSFDFNIKVWKGRTILDLKQIFGVLGDQWLQISAIHFDTIIDSQKVQKLREGKETAKGLLNTYIKYIGEYSEIEAQRSVIREKGFEDKFYYLLKEHNYRGDELLKSFRDQEDLLGENETLTLENQCLRDNTLQLDNLSLGRLWTGIQNLPTKQFWTLVTIGLGIIATSFTLGQQIERISTKADTFEVKKENADLKINNQTLQKSLDSLISIKPFKNDTLNSKAILAK